ncbi:MAG: hypothetical protein BWY42_00958 [Candidatus Omnitrophica bacterium ADurb.Bin277]|jgi:hypothetical protein|nr:MAG: hypothetical protein BWY42_00958 [Candidatus Omnitrophica bacterium ADurb.Bin277]
MIDSLIAEFIKKEDSLEERIKAHVETRFKELDLDTIMQHPEAELGMFAEQIAQEVFAKFMTEAVLEGVTLAEAVAKRKTEVNINV